MLGSHLAKPMSYNLLKFKTENVGRVEAVNLNCREFRYSERIYFGNSHLNLIEYCDIFIVNSFGKRKMSEDKTC